MSGCATPGCKGFGGKRPYCTHCGPTEAMERLLRAIADGAVLRGRRRGLFSYAWLELPDGVRKVVKLNTVVAALKRQLLIALPPSPSDWRFRLSAKSEEILSLDRE